MAKVFNITADCKPGIHYMVNLDARLAAMKEMIDDGAYFTINRARQYGKTTLLRCLNRYLQNDYYVVLMDFQKISHAKFESENSFSLSFSKMFLRGLKANQMSAKDDFVNGINSLDRQMKEKNPDFELPELFECLNEICIGADKPIVLMIDEVDSATNNQVFLDFLAMLRAYYIDRDINPTFQSVILAGVYDVKNLKRKIRGDGDRKVNSPWNIATDFTVEMSFSEAEIAGMLQEYEDDYHTGMNISMMAKNIFDYTSGYPFLVSRLCKLMDEELVGKDSFVARRDVWTEKGFHEAIKLLLMEKNTLFESFSEKLINDPVLNSMLCNVLFAGNSIVYNFYEPSINIATLFGFIKNQNNVIAVSNRIFETWLYNWYLSTAEMQNSDIYAVSLREKNQFIVNGHLNLRRVLEKFVVHFTDLYGDRDETFIEEEGRRYFLLYLRPIINGTGNYYIESRTRDRKRTDIIVDYLGEQYIIEMKIWHGDEYHTRGEKQLVGYLDAYHKKEGYMVSFNFNKKKKIGVHEIVVGEKRLVEAVV
ncbi:MAG: AAA-like domain-containing protein [Lachnospiraceae bacterium]|nr:AAA-like domain-containing protein [Lachnospiraceae bacterium]